jgi:dTMP kinase
MRNFITFEGGEGTGKSTQIARLASRLRDVNVDVVTTREPGGTPEAEAVRGLLVSGAVGRWSAEAEALLNYAARDHHLHHTIRPALARGAVVLCDRFMDSTRVYQGIAGGCPLTLIDTLEAQVVGDTRPARTLVFDLDPKLGLARAASRNGGIENRFESKGLDHHRCIRDGFLEVARENPQRCRVVDASLDLDAVAAQVWSDVKDIVHG